jgi:hypothetical protein
MQFDKLLVRIGKLLDAATIPYMVIGGQAVLQYGEPRLTKDIDITIGIASEEVEKVLAIAKRGKLKSLPASPKKFARETNVLPAEDLQSGIRIDFIFGQTNYELEAIKNSQKIFVNNVSITFASVEDVIIQKIISGRPRDIEDIANILKKNAQIDAKYILRWLRMFEQELSQSFVKVFKNIQQQVL